MICCLSQNITIFALEIKGALAHLARAFDWQSKGGRFESCMLHIVYIRYRNRWLSAVFLFPLYLDSFNRLVDTYFSTRQLTNIYRENSKRKTMNYCLLSMRCGQNKNPHNSWSYRDLLS